MVEMVLAEIRCTATHRIQSVMQSCIDLLVLRVNGLTAVHIQHATAARLSIDGRDGPLDLTARFAGVGCSRPSAGKLTASC